MGGAKSRRRALAAVVGVELQLRRPRGKVLELCLGRRRGRGAELVIMYDGMVVVVVMMWERMCCGWIEYTYMQRMHACMYTRRVSRLRGQGH